MHLYGDRLPTSNRRPSALLEIWKDLLELRFHPFTESETISGKSEKVFMRYSKSSTSSKRLRYHTMEPQRRMEDAHTLSNPTRHALCATCLPCGCVLLDSVISHVYMHVCVTFCMYAAVRALSQTKLSRLPPHQARQVLLH